VSTAAAAGGGGGGQGLSVTALAAITYPELVELGAARRRDTPRLMCCSAGQAEQRPVRACVCVRACAWVRVNVS
jgi:hypothetical protein